MEKVAEYLSDLRLKLNKAAFASEPHEPIYQRRFELANNSLADYGLAQKVSIDSLAVKIGKETFRAGGLLFGYMVCAEPYARGITEVAKRIEDPSLIQFIAITALIPVFGFSIAGLEIAEEFIGTKAKTIRSADY